jgi:uncharacterized membrane protein
MKTIKKIFFKTIDYLRLCLAIFVVLIACSLFSVVLYDFWNHIVAEIFPNVVHLSALNSIIIWMSFCIIYFIIIKPIYKVINKLNK